MSDLEHGRTPAEVAAYNKAYYLKNRKLKGRGGDDAQKPRKLGSVPATAARKQELRARMSRLIQKAKPLRNELLALGFASADPKKNEAAIKELERKLKPIIVEARQLQREIDGAGLRTAFEKAEKGQAGMFDEGKRNSNSPRGTRR